MKFKEQKTYLPKVEELKVTSQFIDAKGQVLGRLASNIAFILQGKRNNNYTPFFHSNIQVWVKNIEGIKITGNKLEDKMYYRHSGYTGNLKSFRMKELMEKNPKQLLELAVKRMLPKNKLAQKMLKSLKYVE